MAALHKAAQGLYAEIGARNARFKRIHGHWDRFRVAEDSGANFLAAATAAR